MALVMDGWKNLLVDNQDGIVTVTINRPKAMNAINYELMKELEAFFTGLQDAPEADVILLTGAGDKAFVAGADIKEMAVMDSHAGRDWALLGERVTSLIERAPQPVIAAVNDETNLVEKERKIDAIRWNQAEELSTFDYFDINALLAYLVKVNIVARWTRLDDKQGREMLHRLMTSLDGKDLINKQ